MIHVTNQDLIKWQEEYDCDLMPPARRELIEEAKKELSPFPPELEEFYSLTNGLSCDWFSILPIEDPKDIKKTWDGIKRANIKDTTKFLNDYIEAYPNFLNDFLIFADIGGMECAVFKKKNFSIWYQDAEGLNQTNLNLKEFIHTVLREVQEL
ncbi:MAG: SMI1/KNR4 family protein [Proteobacteria bacterium]|nr:SMI1/KNR4 family protein [Pseudomonadota bacterium]